MNASEFRRVLRDDGRLLVAIPAPDDLIELRGAGRDRVARTVETFAPRLHARRSAPRHHHGRSRRCRRSRRPAFDLPADAIAAGRSDASDVQSGSAAVSTQVILQSCYIAALNVFIQNAPRHRPSGLMSVLGHLGALGLFFLAILDSSPLPTFGGPDILIAILAARHVHPWYEYASVATVGSVIGAYLTFRLARKAGSAYLDSKFGEGKVSALLERFKRWGSGVLIASSAIPFPFPTSMIFAAAGASDYPLVKYLAIVVVCPDRQILDGCHYCGPVRKAHNSRVPAPVAVLGVAVALRRTYIRSYRRRHSNEEASGHFLSVTSVSEGTVSC